MVGRLVLGLGRWNGMSFVHPFHQYTTPLGRAQRLFTNGLQLMLGAYA